MADQSVLQFKCNNPECQKLYPVKWVPQGGVFDVVCPVCKKKQKIRIPPKPAAPAGDVAGAAQPKPDPQPTPEPEPKTPNYASAQPQSIGLVLKVNDTADISCPHCGGTTHFEGSDHASASKTIKCTICQGPMIIKIVNPTKHLSPTGIMSKRGKLQISKLGFLRKNFDLKVGSNIIGRRDADCHSDIEFDDPTMSRRSANLVVSINEKGGFFFELKVLNATNPVLVNGQEYHVDDSIYLNYGDTIVMGRTTIRFVQA